MAATGIRQCAGPFSGIRYKTVSAEGGDCVTITSDSPLLALNSSVWGGGFGRVHTLVNRQVPKSYMCDDPVQEMEQFLLSCGLDPAATAAMMTAAYVKDVGQCHMADGELQVSSWVTSGLGNTVRAGTTEGIDQLYPGTINAIVVVDGKLTEAAMANAIITVTEAKAAALQDLGILARNSEQTATGTSTDAVLVAATGRGEPIRYAGTATTVGYMIGKTVYEAMMHASTIYLKRGAY
ncbi:adenosylcobinamide amidohydrolase [Paenibacillus ginsengarvi]|uniref:adenosylcobinamide amidohydrolase n=1 Tax=Paenibacillus ginsengarvi TaxID=400777 RepID=UPI0013150E24|nr:adenosylcobinamide amidohydrolase [Paenibacillus ginsengarvi]